jgi:hypothetical protein
MTKAQAKEIIALYDAARLRVNGNGVVASDVIAEHFKVSRGEGLSRYYEARRTLELGEPCPHCDGRGRLKPEGK